MTDTAPSQPPAEETKPAIPPEFLKTLQDWIAGKSQPAAEVSKTLLDDLKAALAERDSLNAKAQEADKGLRQLTGQMAALGGKVDGLVGAIHRIETHAAEG